MHLAQDNIPLQFCYQFYSSLILVGVFGGCVSFSLALMTINETTGIESALILSSVGLFGLLRILMPPWSTMTDEEDNYFSFDGNNHSNKNYQAKLLCELAVDTYTLGKENENDNSLFLSPAIRDSPCSICLQCFEIGQEVSEVSACKHAFHSNCLQLWTNKSDTCPYCRQDMKKKPPREEKSGNEKRCRHRGALGIFEGAFDSIFDLTS